jgi:hypothetical protein
MKKPVPPKGPRNLRKHGFTNGLWRLERDPDKAIEKRNAFYRSDTYRNMTTAEKCAVQDDGFLNDYD